MNIKHAKSPCCFADVWHFGPRRRQCSDCKRTWTIRPRKKGRRAHRIPVSTLKKFFSKGHTLPQLFSRRVHVGPRAYRFRFRNALIRFTSRQFKPEIPAGPLVLLADGLWFEFEARPWVLYLLALKSATGTHAVFLDPLLLPGKEGISRWRKALQTIPPQAKHRIQAIVVDNLPGMRLLARQNNWILQLCHFHMLLKLQGQRRGIRRALKGGQVRDEINKLIRAAVTLPDGPELETTIRRLKHISKSDCGTRRIQIIVREFLRQLTFYRSYLSQPIGLPTTNNAVESMGRIVREMFRRNRAGSNPKSVLIWAKALIRIRPRVVCNGG